MSRSALTIRMKYAMGDTLSFLKNPRCSRDWAQPRMPNGWRTPVFIVSVGDRLSLGRNRNCRCNGLRLGNPGSDFYPASEIGEMERIPSDMTKRRKKANENEMLKYACDCGILLAIQTGISFNNNLLEGDLNDQAG